MVVLSVAGGRDVTGGGGGGGGGGLSLDSVCKSPHALRSVEGLFSSTKIALVVFTLAAQ